MALIHLWQAKKDYNEDGVVSIPDESSEETKRLV